MNIEPRIPEHDLLEGDSTGRKSDLIHHEFGLEGEAGGAHGLGERAYFSRDDIRNDVARPFEFL